MMQLYLEAQLDYCTILDIKELSSAFAKSAFNSDLTHISTKFLPIANQATILRLFTPHGRPAVNGYK